MIPDVAAEAKVAVMLYSTSSSRAASRRAELAVGEASRLDIGLLSPQRFARKTAE
jgi:hypothetical protein